MSQQLPAGGRTRANGRSTRQRILMAAEELFSAKGYEEVTVRDIAAQAGADPALVIRYFGSKNDLFVLARKPNLDNMIGTDIPLTAATVTRALVNIVLDQGTRVLDVTAVGQSANNEFVRDQIEELLVRPLLQGFNLKHEDQARAETAIALILGVGFLRQRVRTSALTALDPEQLTKLLAPHIETMLQN